MSDRSPLEAGRRERDAYYTPDDVAESCVKTIAHRIGKAQIIEPSVGGGAFLHAVLNAGAWRSNTVACDINPDAAGLALAGSHHVGDFLTMPQPHDVAPLPVWVVGNPPYGQAMEHVEHALSLAMPERKPQGGVAFLLRLAFVESEARRSFWRQWPVTELHILSKRPSFTGGKTDSCAYAFFVWHAGDRQPVGWI